MNDVRRALRRREFARVYPGVYVDHTGPLSPAQRGWAAVLWAGEAALCGASARRGPGSGTVEVAVTAPPRLSLEHNVLIEVAQARDETDVVAALTGTIGRNGVTAAAVRRALTLHSRLPRIALVRTLLDDIELGTESVLEHGFLTRVERPHGLPAPVRQSQRRNGRERPDMEYAEFGLVGAPTALASGHGGAVPDRPVSRPSVVGQGLAHPTHRLLPHLPRHTTAPRSVRVTR